MDSRGHCHQHDPSYVPSGSATTPPSMDQYYHDEDPLPARSLAFLPSPRLSPRLLDHERVTNDTTATSQEHAEVTLSPPPRRVGSSIPSPQSTPHLLPSSSSTSTNTYNYPFSSSSSSPHAKLSIPQRLSRIAQLSYLGLQDLFHLIHPNKSFPFTAHLTDQASIALICYKLYALSITLPPFTKIYAYYAPSCLLSDLVAVVILQLGWYLAFGRQCDIQKSRVTTPRESPTFNTNNGGRRYKSPANWKELVTNIIKSPFQSYGYTALPNTSTITQISPETPVLQRSTSGNGAADRAEAGLGLGITAEEEGRSLLFDWAQDEETPTRAPSSTRGREHGSARPDQAAEKQKGDTDEYHEDVTMVAEEEEEDDDDPKYKISSYDEDLLRDALGTRKRTWKSIAVQAFWTSFRIAHVLACVIAIVFTVIAIGAYSAGREYLFFACSDCSRRLSS